MVMMRNLTLSETEISQKVTERQTDTQMDRQTEGWMDRQTDHYLQF